MSPTRRGSLAKRLAAVFNGGDVAKAAGSGGGGGGGVAIDAGSVGSNPVDPETGEPMEFALGQQLTDVTPEALEARRAGRVCRDLPARRMADPWAD